MNNDPSGADKVIYTCPDCGWSGTIYEMTQVLPCPECGNIHLYFAIKKEKEDVS